MDWHLLAAALLLAPIVYLFRFVGCNLIATFDTSRLEECEPLRQLAVDLRVMFYPEPGTDGDDYQVAVAFDPEAEDQETETATWPPPPGEPGGRWQWHPSDTEEPRRLLYLLDPIITEGEHLVTCRVFPLGVTLPRFEVACPEPVALDTDGQRVRFGQAPDGPEAPFEADECLTPPEDGG